MISDGRRLPAPRWAAPGPPAPHHREGEDMAAAPAAEQGPKYFVNLEGVVKPWDEPQISVPEIRKLAGGWDTSQPVVEVNLEDNTEQTLAEDAVVTLKPGHGFEKKIKFQRG